MISLTEALLRAEDRLDQLGRAVMDGTPEAALAIAASLRDVALHLATITRNVPLSRSQHATLKRCAQRLREIRDSHARRAAAVDRELRTLLPDTVPATYAGLRPGAAVTRAAAAYGRH